MAVRLKNVGAGQEILCYEIQLDGVQCELSRMVGIWLPTPGQAARNPEQPTT
jgi:hypothetical protein